MGSRTFQAGGFAVSVKVPDRVGRALRKVVPRPAPATPPGPPDQLVVGPAPAPNVERRNPEGGVSFIRSRIDRRTASRPAPPEGDDRAALAAEIAAHPWYHTLDLGDGLVTNGIYDHRPLVPHYGIPADLTGMRVLDVASADGFWAFEFERRGADVTSIDIPTTDEVDLPEAVRAVARKRGLVDPLRHGLLLAHRALASKVEVVDTSVYDLSPDELGTFDLVHSGDVLLHLRDPLRALERIRSVTGSSALLSDVFDPGLGLDGHGRGLMRYGGGWETAGWWIPSLDTLAQLVIDAGFSDVDVVTTYCLPPKGQAEGPWRAVLRATA